MLRATRSGFPELWSVVLAAGSSSRLGRTKQLLRVRRQSMIVRAIRLAETVTPGRVVVVLGAHRARLRAHLRAHGARSRIACNSGWRRGMGSSLATGVRSLPPSADAVLVLLSDQPYVGARALARLVGAWRRRPRQSAASAYIGRLGVPAVFPRSAFRRLRRSRGDLGARAMLRAAADVTVVELPEAAFDVDTPAEAARL